MTAFELCGEYHDETFKLKGGSVIWESISYNWKNDKCYISRVVEKKEGGKNWFLGLNYISRYISPDTIIKIINHET